MARGIWGKTNHTMLAALQDHERSGATRLYLPRANPELTEP
jgi:hypothetical protein